MLGIEQYRKLQELKELGVSKLNVSEKLNLSYKTVSNWWDRDEEFFNSFQREHEFILDNYRQYIIEILWSAINKVDTSIGEANPLTGLLSCADCGAKMYNQRTRGSDTKPYSYDAYEYSTYKLVDQKRSAADRVKDAYGEKYDPMMMQDSKRDMANLLHEEAEVCSVREFIRRKHQQKPQQKQNKKKNRDSWER